MLPAVAALRTGTRVVLITLGTVLVAVWINVPLRWLGFPLDTFGDAPPLNRIFNFVVWGQSGASWIRTLLLLYLGLVLIQRTSLGEAVTAVGLRAPVLRAAAFGALVALPSLLVFGGMHLLGLDADWTERLRDYGWSAFERSPWQQFERWIAFPLKDVVLFFGFPVLLLYRRAGLGFWWTVGLVWAVAVGTSIPLFVAFEGVFETAIWILAAPLGIVGTALMAWMLLQWKDNLWLLFFLGFWHGLVEETFEAAVATSYPLSLAVRLVQFLLPVYLTWLLLRTGRLNGEPILGLRRMEAAGLAA